MNQSLPKLPSVQNNSTEQLLTQILHIVTELHNNSAAQDERLQSCERTLSELQEKLQSTIARAFPEGDLESHKTWHEKRNMGPIRRTLIRLIS